MKRVICIFVIALIAIGCQSKPELIGDKRIRRYFPNTAENEQKIPADQRLYFDDRDAAFQQGYIDARETQFRDK